MSAKYREAERWPFFESWDGGDPWGSTISHLFGIAEAVYTHSGQVFESFSPGLGSGQSGDEYPDCLYLEGLESGEIDYDKLEHWYRVRLRYDALLRHYGHDY